MRATAVMWSECKKRRAAPCVLTATQGAADRREGSRHSILEIEDMVNFEKL